jgi:hypothetical protein
VRATKSAAVRQHELRLVDPVVDELLGDAVTEEHIGCGHENRPQLVASRIRRRHRTASVPARHATVNEPTRDLVDGRSHRANISLVLRPYSTRNMDVGGFWPR